MTGLVAILGACHGAHGGYGQHEIAGAAAGGAVGGYVGSQASGGSPAGTALGTALGLFFGASVGRGLDQPQGQAVGPSVAWKCRESTSQGPRDLFPRHRKRCHRETLESDPY